MKKITTFLSVVTVLAALSCQKTPDIGSAQVLESGPASDIQVIDGRLKFSSKEDFEKTVAMLAKQQDKLKDFEQKFDGFVSVRTAFSRMTDKDNEIIATQGVGDSYKGYVTIVDEGEDKEIAPTIIDPILATIVSKDGWVYIGNDAFYFARDKFQQVKNSSARKIADVIAGRLKGPDVISGTVSHSQKKLAGARAGGTTGCIANYFDGDNKRRITGDIDYTFYDGAAVSVAYESLTIYSKHQRRNLGTYWTYIPCPRLDFNGSLNIVSTTGNNRTEFFSAGDNNTSLISKSYPASGCTNIPGAGRICNETYKGLNSRHSGTSTDGVFLSCNVSTPN